MKWKLIIPVLLLLFACKKPDERRCTKSAGKEKTIEINLGEFNQIKLGPHLIYSLVQDTVNKLVVTGGSNLITFVETDITDGLLTVENKNICNFLRSYKKEIEVEVHFKDVNKLQFEGTKPLTCKNKLQLSNIVVVIRDGAGAVDLNMDANALDITITHGWGNFVLHGSVNYLRMEVRSNGFGESYDMAVNDSILVVTSSQDLVKVNCDGALMRAQVIEDGDIWYKGHPSYLEKDLYGNGQVIDKN